MQNCSMQYHNGYVSFCHLFSHVKLYKSECLEEQVGSHLNVCIPPEDKEIVFQMSGGENWKKSCSNFYEVSL